jgi:hypothetical protein
MSATQFLQGGQLLKKNLPMNLMSWRLVSGIPSLLTRVSNSFPQNHLNRKIRDE